MRTVVGALLLQFLLTCFAALGLFNHAWAAVPAAATGTRLALVIGNDTYSSVPKLANARADARAMAQALQQAGFDVTLRTDMTRSAMLDAIRTFKARLSGGNDAVFYFAGHGVQLGAANYLLPVDITAANEEQVKDDALPLQRVLDDLTEQKVRFSLAIIDACRDNPFPRVAGRSIGGTRGLAPTTAATGQMVIYSAGTGQQALDKLGNSDRNPNGLFTRVFLQEMQRPGIEVGQMLRNVRNQVVSLAKQVGHEQVPALYDQAVGEFSFVPGVGASSTPQLQAAPITPFDPTIADRAFWDSVKETRNAEELKAYLSEFPNGLFASLANARLRALDTPKPVAPPPPQAVPETWVRFSGDADSGSAVLAMGGAVTESIRFDMRRVIEADVLSTLRQFFPNVKMEEFSSATPAFRVAISIRSMTGVMENPFFGGCCPVTINGLMDLNVTAASGARIARSRRLNGQGSFPRISPGSGPASVAWAPLTATLVGESVQGGLRALFDDDELRTFARRSLTGEAPVSSR